MTVVSQELEKKNERNKSASVDEVRSPVVFSDANNFSIAAKSLVDAVDVVRALIGDLLLVDTIPVDLLDQQTLLRL
jgi:hypothetical protein